MPDVRFDEIMVIQTEGRNKIKVNIDKNYIHVCEPDTIQPIGYTASGPCTCGLNVSGGELKIDIEGNTPKELRIKLSGIRKNFGDKRFEKFTYDEMRANNAFWMQWKDD
jgi:hypothetical protein